MKANTCRECDYNGATSLKGINGQKKDDRNDEGNRGDDKKKARKIELSSRKTNRVSAEASKSSEKCLWRASLTSNLTFQNEVAFVSVCL